MGLWPFIGQIVATISGVAVVFVPLWIAQRQDRRSLQEHREKLEGEQRVQREQNLVLWNRLVDELSEHPPHYHQEMEGALSAEGIIMRRDRKRLLDPKV